MKNEIVNFIFHMNNLQKNPRSVYKRKRGCFAPPISPGGQKWGGKLVARRVLDPNTIQLLVSFHKKRKTGLRYQLDDPFPKERQPNPAVNIIQQALYVKAHLKINPNEFAIVTAEKLGIHRKRIPKLMTILDRIPAKIQRKLYDCHDNRIHRIFSLQTLHKIAQLKNKEQIYNRFHTIKPNEL